MNKFFNIFKLFKKDMRNFKSLKKTDSINLIEKISNEDLLDMDYKELFIHFLKENSKIVIPISCSYILKVKYFYVCHLIRLENI
jgi:hypothetical protein